MTIGEQLKKTRNTLQLTQKQMSEGIISESFYSKVECDKSRINIIDLIKILNRHQISLYDFFEPFDEHVFYKENIHCKIVSAFNSHNVKELKNIQTNISNNKLALEIQLMIALLQNKIEELPEKLRQEMRCNILQVGIWNQKSLLELSIVMRLYNFDELTILMESIFEEYSAINFDDSQTIVFLANIFSYYLIKSYKLDNLTKCQKVITYIENLPCNLEIILVKILGKYYQAKVNNNVAEINKIQNLLKSSGYEKYL